MTDGLWPHVDVGGRLDAAEQEWIHTNGAGAYATSTVAMMHTRRYHAVLVAALDPPARRFAILSHAETNVATARRTYRLAAHQFPGVAPMPGFRYLQSFDQDPLPRWTYRLGKARFERVLGLVRGQNAVVLRYTWFGKKPARLLLSPLLSMRDHHTVMREHGAMVQRVRIRPTEVEIEPVPGIPPVVFGHDGLFIGSPDWYRRFEHAEDKLRGLDGEEDLWTPGTFEILLPPKQPTFFTVAVGRLPGVNPEDALDEAARALLGADPGEDRNLSVRSLSVAAEAFASDAGPCPAIIAGYPWLGPETRDALATLPGIYLARGQVERAKRLLSTVVEASGDGLLPRRLCGDRSEADYAADATLWFFEAVRLVVAALGPKDEFVQGTLYPAMVQTYRRVRSSSSSILTCTEEGLVRCDDVDGVSERTRKDVETGRRGYLVELQALWIRGSETLADLARVRGEVEVVEEVTCLGAMAARTFKATFWCKETSYPYDWVLRGQDGDRRDPSIRPNALVAADLAPALFSHSETAAILNQVRQRLLSPRGIRSLDPNDPLYRGAYAGALSERRFAYHHGLAWTHLLGAYARVALRLAPDDFDLVEDLRGRIEALMDGGDVLGQVNQFADGEPPHAPGGCPAYALGVAELLRTLVWDLRL